MAAGRLKEIQLSKNTNKTKRINEENTIKQTHTAPQIQFCFLGAL